MKKKIYWYMVGLAVAAIMLTITFSTFVFYDSFKKQVIVDLKEYSELLKMADLYNADEAFYCKSEVYNIRLTIVNADGKVIYDTKADTETMENHLDRPEIREAFESGKGHDIRYSETFKANTFYYAVRMDDFQTGECYVIRVSKEASSIFNIFSKSIPVLIVVTLTGIVCCIIFAHICTKSVLRPIEHVTKHLDDLEHVEVYKELKPFVGAIEKQHTEILNSANLRQEFTANVSHELKTPLASISGYSELIESGMATGDDVRNFAKEIHRNAKRLLTLINDIIRLSQLDSTGFRVNFATVDLREVATDCIEMLALHAENRKVFLQLEGDSILVQGEKSMLEEVVYNLCDNAIRYNKPGGYVKIRLSEDEEHAYLAVEDNGIGISQENQKRVFERFYRVDKSRSKESGGTGLGLAIVKHIVLNHKANVQIESELDKGTTITVVFDKR